MDLRCPDADGNAVANTRCSRSFPPPDGVGLTGVFGSGHCLFRGDCGELIQERTLVVP